jgi:micrococcal nuclease
MQHWSPHKPTNNQEIIMNTQARIARLPRTIGAAIVAGALIASLASCAVNDIVPSEPSTSAAPEATEDGVTEFTPFKATLVRVIDGDTIEVARSDGGELITVRLLGIDAPESDECGGPEATAFLTDFVNVDDTLDIIYDAEADTVDQYDRHLAYAKTNIVVSYDLGLSIIESGHANAWYPKGEPAPEKNDAYVEKSESAQAKNTGLWAVCDTLGR